MVAQLDITGECESNAPTTRDGPSQVRPTSCDDNDYSLPPLQVSDDFVGSAPVGRAELEAIEAYLGDILDAVLG